MSDPLMRDFAADDSRPPVRWHWMLCVALVLIAIAASVL
ncbi:hypothetical protein FHS29_002680 [Saccharothrix tamanrassetensis]|uniref:Uncharacterized protein n=1 Tax=Saccharothrix tamanrassetensis TaxID=1051531 RepID=A0A841CIA4_9PSEU|nr:hypothetical protein [Saccharothrix tamanrassetensis]